ncbi:MAG: TatD family hydrolase [Bacilli bacterium]|nr:TatD family hydrolase [Bacilli bacterium]
MFIDTHCHLSLEDYENIDSVIQDNRQAGIKCIIISGCTKESIQESLKYADLYEDVYVTIGYHPSEASLTTEADILAFEELLSHKKVIGIGEIGLDYHYGKEDASLQKELFRKQMLLADKHHLPVVIHSRDATEETINILKEFPSVKGDIHCFSGSLETAKQYISMGYYLGIGGVVTFKNSKLFSVIQQIGISSVLLETDSPYLTPEPNRGKQNSSKYIPAIAKCIAEVCDLTIEEVSKITLQNTYRLFDLK